MQQHGCGTSLCDGNTTALTSLDLYYESISGTIPVELAALTSLNGLELGGTASLGPYPSSLPPSHPKFPCLENASISGTIPVELATLTSLYRLWLYSISIWDHTRQAPSPRLMSYIWALTASLGPYPSACRPHLA